MFFESLLVLSVLVVILIFFYKQAVTEFRILQVDSLEKAQPLLSERNPIVVLPAPTPQQFWTRADLESRPTLANSLYNGVKLRDALTQDSFFLKPDSAESLSQKAGLTVWIQQQIVPTFRSASWWTPCLLSRSEVAIGAQGLRQTYGYTTILMATDGAIQVSLLNPSANPYLPEKWKGKRLNRLTRDDAPFLSQIQCIDVIVRPGSALLIPPHWKVCWENLDSKITAMVVWAEIHHPLSWFLYRMAERRSTSKLSRPSRPHPPPRENDPRPRLPS